MKYTHGALVRGSQKVKDRVMEEVEKEAYWGRSIYKLKEGRHDNDMDNKRKRLTNT